MMLDDDIWTGSDPYDGFEDYNDYLEYLDSIGTQNPDLAKEILGW